MFLFSSCVSLNNFQSAKTLEKGEIEIGMGGSVGSTFDLDGEDVDTVNGVIQRGIPFSDITLFGRYGLAEKLDFGLRGSSIGDFGVDFKYMAIGNQNSTFAFSPGLAIGSNIYYLGVSRMFQVEVPLHTSIDLSDNFTLFITPRYVGQNMVFTIFDNVPWVNYAGGSFGFEVGNELIFSLGLNYLKAVEFETISTFNVAAGIRYRFSGNTNGQ